MAGSFIGLLVEKYFACQSRKWHRFRQFYLQWGTKVLRHFCKIAPFWIMDLPIPFPCLPPPLPPKINVVFWTLKSFFLLQTTLIRGVTKSSVNHSPKTHDIQAFSRVFLTSRVGYWAVNPVENAVYCLRISAWSIPRSWWQAKFRLKIPRFKESPF